MSQAFANKPFGQPFIILQSVDSTNKYAMELVHEDMSQHGMAVFAKEQYAGRGQWGKNWQTEKGANIILSLIIKPEGLIISRQFSLSVCTALAARDFFAKYAGEDDTRIKWPNDIYWRDRKAGGILIETVIGNRKDSSSGMEALVKWAVAGIGININQTLFPPNLPNPVSLKQVTGKTADPEEMARELCTFYDGYYQQLTGGNASSLLQLYNNYLYRRNEKIKLKKGSRVFEAIVKEVLPDGHLRVQHTVEEELAVGDVEWAIG